MGFVSGLFSGDKGANYEAGSAPILTPTNGVQLTNDRNAEAEGINQYQKFLQAIQAQGGLQKQGDVYGQLQQIASGQGPNPAQAMLDQATGTNVANQAALMASARGVNANPGLIARQAANVGANVQQQAAGQGAVMQANQALGAIGQAGQLANTMAGQELQGQNTFNNLVQNQRAQTLGAAQSYNDALVKNTSSQNTANSAIAQGNQAFQAGTVGSIAKGAGMAAGLAHGGQVPMYAEGTPDAPIASPLASPDVATQGAGAPQSATAKFLKGVGESTAYTADNPQARAMGKAGADVGSSIGQGIGSLFKPGAAPSGGAGAGIMQTAGPASTMMIARGGSVGSKLKEGGKVPGQAKVKGDSYANDTVAAKLSPGEVVIPRSVMQSKDPAKAAADFVSAVMAKSGKLPRK